MNEETFAFQKLVVRRMPGFPSGSWELPDLSPGINVISGPNASGKSTTARALETFIWPRASATREIQLAADFTLGGEKWHAEIDGTHYEFQRAGVPADPPTPKEESTGRDRYSLALHDLLATHDKDFAQTIVREAAGGYDVSQAAAALGFSESIPRPRKLWQDYNAACNEVAAAVAAERNLEREQTELTELEIQLAAAQQAGVNAENLRRAIEAVQRVAEFDVAETALREFDPRIGRITGGELDQFTNKCEAVASFDRELAGERERFVTAEAELADCKLPTAGVEAGVVEMLRNEIGKLKESEVEAQRSSREIAAAQARSDAARRLIGDTVDEASLAGLDAVRLNELADFSRRVEDHEARQSAHDELFSWVGEITPGSDLRALREADLALAMWLRTPANAQSFPLWLKPLLIIISTLIALGSITLGMTGRPAAFAGLIAASLIIVAVFALRKNGGVSSAPPHMPAGITPPAHWDVETVRQRLTEIQQELAATQVDEEKRQRWARLTAQREQLAASAAEMERESAEIATRFGWSLQGRAFHVVANAISAWQSAYAEALASTATLNAHQEQCASMLVCINARLGALDYPESASAIEATARFRDLESRETRWREANAKCASAARMTAQLESQRKQCEQEIAKILEATGTTDERDLRGLCEQLPAFNTARKIRDDAAVLQHQATLFFAAHPQLGKRSTEELKSELLKAEARAGDLAGLAKRIGEIQGAINSAKESDRNERALAERERLRDELVDEREQGLASLAGHILASNVREQSRERALPRVFLRARELFTKITAGAARLEIDLANAEFRAVDNITGAGRGLDELSSGTRVQLLLAVRAAFVAEQEKSARLPLLLDETLGNSDDHRSREIIAAIAALAREGRQIFYFTAQWDELGKWREFSEQNSDLPVRFIDMAEARHLAKTPEFEHLPAPDRPSVPDPGTLSYEDYGRDLGVPPFDPADEHPGALHVWHVCEDTKVVYRLLSQGIERWGQLEDCLRLRSLPLVAGSEARLQANARLLETLGRYWRQGRGRRVNRDALIDAEVTQTFLEKIWNCALGCDRDARRLLEYLDGGSVKGLQKRTIQKLREHLEEKGFVSSDTPLDAATIRLRLLPFAQEHGIDEMRLDSCLKKIHER